MSCRIKRKQECIDSEDCKWTVGKGCSPIRPSYRRRSPRRGCTRFRKNDCSRPCKWIKGTGCRSPQFMSPPRYKSAQNNNMVMTIKAKSASRGVPFKKCDNCWMPLDEHHEKCQPVFKRNVIESLDILLTEYEDVGISREYMYMLVLDVLTN